MGLLLPPLLLPLRDLPGRLDQSGLLLPPLLLHLRDLPVRLDRFVLPGLLVLSLRLRLWLLRDLPGQLGLLGLLLRWLLPGRLDPLGLLLRWLPLLLSLRLLRLGLLNPSDPLIPSDLPGLRDPLDPVDLPDRDGPWGHADQSGPGSRNNFRCSTLCCPCHNCSFPHMNCRSYFHSNNNFHD